MSKKLIIGVKAESTVARISIIGEISEWNANNAENLRCQCQTAKEAGATKAWLYLMTVGGDCFQANEIENILDEMFPGEWDGEGGALVASAGAYLAVRCKSFELAKNGQFMIHKPQGGAWGNETEISNRLVLIQNMTKTYYEAFIAKCKKPEAEFKAKWDAGDFWLTAKEAEEWGFITKVKGPINIDEPTAQLLRACGAPNNDSQINAENNMDSKTIALLVGLATDSTDAQLNAHLTAIVAKANKYDELKADVDRKEKEQKASNIKAELDKGEKEKKFKPEARADWQKAFEGNFTGTKALLDGIQPVVKASSSIKRPSDSNSVDLQGKTFEQIQDESPELLAEIEETQPEVYASLFEDYKKRNKIK